MTLQVILCDVKRDKRVHVKRAARIAVPEQPCFIQIATESYAMLSVVAVNLI